MGTQVVRSISRVSYLVLRKKLHPKFKMYAARIVLPAARIAASSSAAVRPVAALPMVQFRGLQTTVAKQDIDSAARNPSLKQQLFSYAILGFALSEAMGLFCLMMAFLLLFAF